MVRIYKPENSPEQNLEILANNPYPGRVLAQGFIGDVAVQACAIMGRSPDSRNRIYTEEDGIVSTEVFDKSKPAKDPALTIYDAMRRTGDFHVVSNGDQTSTAIQHLRAGSTFEDAMKSRRYEPDAPNFTPRITGFIDLRNLTAERVAAAGISVIRKLPVSDLALHTFFNYYNLSGFAQRSGGGRAVHTYQRNDDPLPSFKEEPFSIPLRDNASEMARLLWNNLDKDNRVAVAAKVFTRDDHDIHIINAHQ